MFNEGLSLDQAPPISVPFRFFITAPIFAIIIGLLILTNDSNLIVNRYSNISIALVHLFTLGILSMIIVGAMQQMMPVLAGAVIKRPILFANIVHISLTLGTIFFTLYFIYSVKAFMMFATAFLSIAFVTFFSLSIKLLFNVKFVTPTVTAMRVFTIAGSFAILIGLHLAGAHISENIGATHYSFVALHILFGMFGFALIIIMGVAFQVVPMFYVAKDFPKFIQKFYPYGILALIFLYAIFEFTSLNVGIVNVLIAFIAITFASYGIHSLNNRRRPIFDVTLLYWKLSLYSLMIAMFVWIFLEGENSYLLAVLFGLGFLYSLLQGMTYKIIPFLCWFHLSSKGYFSVPTMRDLIKEDKIRIQFYMYFASILFFILASFLSGIFMYIGAGLFIYSNILFLINILYAIKDYIKIAKTDPMDMSAFQMPS